VQEKNQKELVEELALLTVKLAVVVTKAKNLAVVVFIR
jgi:hypothetical protein